MSWEDSLLDKVFTRVKRKIDADCSTENENVTPSVFPSVYIQELAPLEVGQDLDNLDTPFVLYTIQVKVWDKSENGCKEIAYQVKDAMKEMRFNVIAFPDIQTQDNISFALMRFRRLIGDGDKL